MKLLCRRHLESALDVDGPSVRGQSIAYGRQAVVQPLDLDTVTSSEFTVRVTAVVSIVDPEAPVTVTVYVPAVVPKLPEPLPLLPLLLRPPPQLERPPVNNASSISMPSMARQPRRRAGMQISISPQTVTPAGAAVSTTLTIARRG